MTKICIVWGYRILRGTSASTRLSSRMPSFGCSVIRYRRISSFGKCMRGGHLLKKEDEIGVKIEIWQCQIGCLGSTICQIYLFLSHEHFWVSMTCLRALLCAILLGSILRCDVMKEREYIWPFFSFLTWSPERERESKKQPFVVLVTCMVYEGWGSGDRTHIRVYCVLVLGYTCTWALRILKDIQVATSASFVLTRTGININNANSLLHGRTCIFSMVYTSTMKLNMVTFRQGWGSTSLDCCKCTKRNEPRCPLNHTQALVARLYQPSKPLGAKAVS